eukprot:499279-Prymnesium_polylepis.1
MQRRRALRSETSGKSGTDKGEREGGQGERAKSEAKGARKECGKRRKIRARYGVSDVREPSPLRIGSIG